MSQVLAFDGERYHSMVQGGTSTLKLQRDALTNVYGGIHPLVVLYPWACPPCDKHALPALQSLATWERVASLVRSCEEASMLGHDGLKLVLLVPRACTPTDEQPDRYEVFFAADLDYLPLHYTRTHPQTAAEVQVEDIVTVEDAYGTIRFPTRIITKDIFPDGEVAQEGAITVDEDTLRINADVDPARLAISPSESTWVVDVDAASRSLSVQPERTEAELELAGYD